MSGPLLNAIKSSGSTCSPRLHSDDFATGMPSTSGSFRGSCNNRKYTQAYRRSSVRIKRTDFSNYSAASSQVQSARGKRSDALDRRDNYDDHSDSDDYDEDLKHLESDESEDEVRFTVDAGLNFDEDSRIAASVGSRHSHSHIKSDGYGGDARGRPTYISTSPSQSISCVLRSPGKNLTGASSASALMMMSTSPPCPEDSFLHKQSADDLGSAELDILLDEADADDLIKSTIRIRGRRATTAGSRIGSRNSNSARDKELSSLSGDEMDHQGRRFLSVNVTTARSVNSLADVHSCTQRRPSTHQRSCSSNYLEVPTGRFGASAGNSNNNSRRNMRQEMNQGDTCHANSMALVQLRSHSCQNTRAPMKPDHHSSNVSHRNSCFDRRNSGYHSWNVSPLGSPSSPRNMDKSYSARTSLAGVSYLSDESFDPVLALTGPSSYGSSEINCHHHRRPSLHCHSYSHQSQPDRNFNPPNGGSSCRSGSINSHSSYCFDRSVASSKFPSPSSPRSMFSDRSSACAFGPGLAATASGDSCFTRSGRSVTGGAFDGKSPGKETSNGLLSRGFTSSFSGQVASGSRNLNAHSWQLMSPSSPVSPVSPAAKSPCSGGRCQVSSLSLDFPRTYAQSLGGSRRPFVLQRSLFPNVSPTIYFASDEDDCTENMIVQLPKELRQYLKWKLSSITPALVRETVIRSGFKLIKERTKTKKWLGTWCKHIKSVDFSLLNHDYNKVNHFPGSFHLGRKDKLWFNLQEKSLKFGEAVFSDFHPATYVLPQDVKSLRRTWINSNGDDWKMILKPPASARGNGITVINKWSQIPKAARMKKRHYNKPVLIAQEYISNPCLLFNQSKFDLRVYVLVTSFNPLRIYIYEDGLVRFASEKYTSNQESLSDPFVHLTNYSINKTNESYKSNNEPGSKKGHKWTMNTLWKYLNEMNSADVNVDSIKAKINDMIIKTLISCEDQIDKLAKKHLRSRYTCFELLGFDIMIDNNFKPWLLEVNISPSLRSESSLDSSVKGKLIKDMLNIVGYRLPSAAIKAATSKLRKSVDSGNATFTLDADFFPPASASSSNYVYADDKFFSFKLSKEEKAKHFKYENEMSEYNYSSILDELTPDDTRILIETEDEFSRRGGFHRIFPGSASDRYMKYFDENRYYNTLLFVWNNRYDEDPAKGIALLHSLAREKYHLKNRYPDHESILNRLLVKWKGIMKKAVLRQLFKSSESSTDTTEAGECPSDHENHSTHRAGCASSISAASGLLSPSSRGNSASVNGPVLFASRNISCRNLTQGDASTSSQIKLLAPTTAPTTPIQSAESPSKYSSKSLQLFCTSSSRVES